MTTQTFKLEFHKRKRGYKIENIPKENTIDSYYKALDKRFKDILINEGIGQDVMAMLVDEFFEDKRYAKLSRLNQSNFMDIWKYYISKREIEAI